MSEAGMPDLALMQIRRDARVAEAFARLNANRTGIVFVTDGEGGRVVGAVTDGDIRRHLLAGVATDDPIERCMNPAFVGVARGTPRERVLKLLDGRIRQVPVLDEAGRLVDICSRERFRLERERRTYARARSPVRISFGGGTTDLTRFFVEHGGAVLNATISLYAHAALRKTDDRRVVIVSHDLGERVACDGLDDLAFDGRLDLIKSVIRLIEPDFGFELQVGSDFPARSGLGGSATVAAAVIGCFNQYREDRWDRHQIAEMAFQAERLQLGIPGGWQDQYATVFGGFNFIEFTADHNHVVPLRLEPDVLRELEASLLLCYTGALHDSGELHRQTGARASEAEIARFAAASRALSLEMQRLLLRGRLMDYGRLLHRSWELKREFSPHATSPALDRIYETAMANGALGGRLLGAGGGGYFLFYARPFERWRLVAALAEAGLSTRNFTFDHQGLQSWTVRTEEGEG